MTATLLDLGLLVLLVVHLVRGARSGGVMSILTMLGALLGGWLALSLAPGQLARHLPGLAADQRSIVLMVLVLLGATSGEILLSALGHRLRSRAHGQWSRRADALVGALAQGLVTCLVVSALGSAVRPVLPASWQRAVNDSTVLPAMGAVVPAEAERWASQLGRALSEAGFPRVFTGLDQEPVLPVAAPDERTARLPAIRAAGQGIVKIRADAPACGQMHEGSGWVVARHRVVTNAHVVAGSRTTTVQVAGQGRALPATVVAFDPNLDLAILDVPTLGAAPLQRASSLGRGASAVVAGFPLDGRLTAGAARIRGTLTAAGDDIFGGKGVDRQVYSLAATVQPGNSGGPLLTPDGRVAGTVFARSLADAHTGYALTDAATASLLGRAASLHSAVSTQGCAKG